MSFPLRIETTRRKIDLENIHLFKEENIETISKLNLRLSPTSVKT